VLQRQLEALLRRDRVVVAACLCAVTLSAAYYIYTGAGMGMTAVQMSVPMQHMGAAAPASWTPLYTLTMFLMWWAMMVAMMLPSAAPTILLSAALNRRSRAEVPPYGGTTAFTLGYLLAWAAFSALATALQWWLEHAGKLSMHMESIDVKLNGSLMLAAGIWQFTPLKASCLKHCRSPVDFLVRYRKQGTLGALRMGANHGLF
jgi:predicted metal-binding membrane protein